MKARLKSSPTTGPRAPNALLHGTLDTLVLKTLSRGPLHGYAIARWIEERSRDALQIEEGSLYPALYRMEARGLLSSSWGTSELGRRAKFYALTRKGRVRLAEEAKAWRAFAGAVAEVLAG
jgi:transcriptional regulator